MHNITLLFKCNVLHYTKLAHIETFITAHNKATVRSTYV